MKRSIYLLVIGSLALLTGCNFPQSPPDDSFGTAVAAYGTATFTPAVTVTATSAVTPSATTAGTATITPTRDPAAPPGMIVFTCQPTRLSSQNQICLVNADGSGWRQLTNFTGADHFYPSFSADNASVLFSSNQGGAYDIYRLELAGGSQTRLTDSGYASAPAESPDGANIVYTYNPGEALADAQLWMMRADGSNRYPLTFEEGGAWDPTWSPDGSQILFASQVEENVQLFIMDSDGSNIEQVTHFTGLRGRNDWSVDDRLSTYIGSAWKREIATFDLEGKNVVYLTSGGNNLAPSFSPGGDWIAYTSYVDNYRDDHGCEIYVMHTDGSGRLRLTDNQYCDWQPRWSK